MFDLLENGCVVHSFIVNEYNENEYFVVRLYDKNEKFDLKWDVVGKSKKIYSATSLMFPHDDFLFDSFNEALDFANDFVKITFPNTFCQLQIGDMFNTLSGRWVKISDTRAICVMDGVMEIGDSFKFLNDTPVIPLYTANAI